METAFRYAMRTFLLILVMSSAPLIACCPVDPDSLDQEASPEVLNLVAGRVEREPAEYWRAELQSFESSETPEPLRSSRSARANAALGNWSVALTTIEACAGGELSDKDRPVVNDLRVRLALTAWWYGGTDAYPAQDCLRIAESAAAGLPHAKIYERIIKWATSTRPADPDSYLPDFLDLRYFTNKSEGKDTGALAERGLGDAEQVLFDLLKFDPVWENFDTIFSLSMVYTVTGRQNLASYTRLRAWEMHENGNRSRVPGAAEIDDIKPMTLFRQYMAGVLVPVRTVNEDYQAVIQRQYEARRNAALKWQKARQDYLSAQLAAGLAANAAGFWRGFVEPHAEFPSMAKTTVDPPAESTPAIDSQPQAAAPAPEPPAPKGSKTVTWITLAVLAGVLLLGGLAKARINASTARMQQATEETRE